MDVKTFITLGPGLNKYFLHPCGNGGGILARALDFSAGTGVDDIEC
jgi:hypothetical protein